MLCFPHFWVQHRQLAVLPHLGPIHSICIALLCSTYGGVHALSGRTRFYAQLCAKSRESPAPPYHLPHHDDDGDNHHDMFTWPYVYSDMAHTMFGVAGGNCPSKCHCNRIRGERYRGKRFTARLVTLPYLTLPYLTLPY